MPVVSTGLEGTVACSLVPFYPVCVINVQVSSSAAGSFMEACGPGGE